MIIIPGQSGTHQHLRGRVASPTRGFGSEDEREIVGISFWASKQSCEAWRASAVEARRREAMAAYVVGEQEAFYRGRELVVPVH
jgi:heme-degrading monooxygenase HmoA